MGQSALAEGRDHLEFTVFEDEWSTDFLLVALLAAAVVATATLGSNPVVQFIVAGIVAVAVYRSTWMPENLRNVTVWSIVGAIAAAAYVLRDRMLDLLGPSARSALEASPVWALLVVLWANPWVKLFLFMVYTGSFIYGGGAVGMAWFFFVL